MGALSPSAGSVAAVTPQELPIRRNTYLLSAALAANSGMLQLSAAVASLTLVLVLGVDQLLGLGPAIVLASGALAALPAGRLMDRIGRVPVIAGGFVVGALGGGLAGLGSAIGSAPIVLAGLVGVGASSGTACSPARRPATCTRPSAAPAGSRSSCSAPCSGRSSVRSSSAPCSPATTRTATASPCCGSPPSASWSSRSPWCCSCAPTRSTSRRCCTRTRASRRPPRRCARSSAAPA